MARFPSGNSWKLEKALEKKQAAAGHRVFSVATTTYGPVDYLASIYRQVSRGTGYCRYFHRCRQARIVSEQRLCVFTCFPETDFRIPYLIESGTSDDPRRNGFVYPQRISFLFYRSDGSFHKADIPNRPCHSKPRGGNL